MTKAKTRGADADSPQWAWLFYLADGAEQDKGVREAMLTLNRHQVEQAAQASGYTLVGDPRETKDKAVLVPGHGDPEDDDYSAGGIIAYDAAIEFDRDGLPVLWAYRWVFDTRPIGA